MLRPVPLRIAANRAETAAAAREELSWESSAIGSSGPGFFRAGQSVFLRYQHSRLLIPACALVVAGLTLMRGIFAAVHPLRVDEAYYWTWSRESVISYLDHPPLVSWCIYLGTLIFGDTNFGVRFSGLVAMLVMQALLADIVWRTTRDWRYAILAVLLPEAALDYGLLITKVVPDTVLIVFALAMVWALVRLALSGNQRWWLLAGVFGGFALLSKYVVILLLPAIVAYALVPSWRMKQLSSPYPWLAALIALAIFSPVLYWNAVHEWASFRFQLDRPIQIQGWSLKFVAEFVGVQFLLVGPILLPVVLIGASMIGRRGFRAKDPIAILLSMSVAVPIGFFLWRSLHARIGDSWPLFVWPFGFACVAINLKYWRQEAPGSSMARIAPSVAAATALAGIGFVVLAMNYYTATNANYLANDDPFGKEAGFAQLVATANDKLEKLGATWFATTDYRIYSMLRWHLKDRVPVVQVNERNRYIGFALTEADLAGPVGLYIAPKGETGNGVWGNTTAVLEPAGEADLTWRGVRYDTYKMQKLTNWRPLLSPPPGDPLFRGAPH
jgi:4-amino-4-deoxy-L-arabinose transferase-like glycosyltransferase